MNGGAGDRKKRDLKVDYSNQQVQSNLNIYLLNLKTGYSNSTGYDC